MSPPSETSRRSNRYMSDLTYWFTSDIVESATEHLIKIGIIQKIVKNPLIVKVNVLVGAGWNESIDQRWLPNGPAALRLCRLRASKHW